MKKSVLLFLFVLISVFLWQSCKTKEKLNDFTMPENVDEVVLVKSILDNQLVYDNIYFKRMLLELDENGKSKSVRANMYIKKDSSIVISIIPLMGIEVFRVCLDSNNIRIIDRLNRKFITSSYKYITDKYGVNVNYKVVESLLTNSVFSYPDGSSTYLSKYSGNKVDQYYSLKSVDNKRYDRLIKRKSDLFLHEIKVLPDVFRVSSSSIINVSEGLSMDVDYSNFIDFGNTKFPEKVTIVVKEGENVYRLVLSYKDMEINGTNSLNFRLPDKYEVTTY